MKVICVGGASSSCGKTSVVGLLLRAFPGWGAIKVTPCRPGGACPHGRRCGACEPPASGYEVVTDDAIFAEPGKDTAQFLAAGASRVAWVRSLPEHLPEALETALARFADAPGVIIESTTAIPLVDGLRILVARRGDTEFKPSAHAALALVDLIALNWGVPAPSGRIPWWVFPSQRPMLPVRPVLPLYPHLAPADLEGNKQFIEYCRRALEAKFEACP